MEKYEGRLRIDNTLLTVVDMQERLLPAMGDRDSVLESCGKLVKGCRILSLPALFTQQYTKGLGGTAPSIMEAATPEAATGGNPRGEGETGDPSQKEFSHIEKTSFSVMGEPMFLEALEREESQMETHLRNIIVCGIEAHVCVLQSVEDMLDAGYAVYLASDAVASRSATDQAMAVRRMRAAGAVVTTTESILFELLRGADHPRFRDISRLVK